MPLSRADKDLRIEHINKPRREKTSAEAGTYRSLVKVVDILGVDTSQLLEITVE